MTTIQIPNEILRKLPGPALRLVLQLNLAREPLTGDVLATLCDKSKNWASMTVPSAREALEPLGYSIKNDGNGYYIVKHEVVAAPPVVRKSSSATLTVPAQLPVTSGRATGGTARLSFGDVVCTYEGREASAYTLASCSNGAGADTTNCCRASACLPPPASAPRPSA